MGHQNSTSPKRRLVFVALTVLLAVLAIELLSLTALSIKNQRLMTPSRVRDRLSAALVPTSAAGLDDEQSDWDDWAQMFALHPYLGYVFDDGFEREARLDVGGHDAVNYGFSLAENGVFHQPAERTMVAVITGGSVAFNVGRRFGDHIATVVQTGLARDYDRVIVVNAAVPGYHQPQQLLEMNYLWALGGHFDVVINLDGFNEIALVPEENLSTGVAPFFPYAWYFKVTGSGTDTRLAMAELKMCEQRRRALAEFFARSPWRYSSTASVVWSSTDNRVVAQMRDIESSLKKDRDRNGPSFTASGPRNEYLDLGAAIKQMAEIWRRASIQLDRGCESVGARYYHFLQPNQYVPESKPMNRDEHSSSIDPEHEVVEYVLEGYPLLSAYGRQLRDQGIRFHDLTMLFADTSAPIYIDTCCHYNATGDQMVAQAIGEAIVADFLTSEGSGRR